jgi:alpha-amylase
MKAHRLATCVLAALLAFQYGFAQDPVMIQGFYWNVRPGGVWYDTLKSRAAQLKRAGFTAVYYPPVYKGNAGGSDVGYTPYDWYDLGEYDSRGGNISSGGGSDIPTRYGTYSKLQASINEFHAQGMQVYADIVMNHREGGLLETNPYLSLAGSCPPPSVSGQTYTAFPLTYGSGRLAWTAGSGAQFFYPNAAVNASNTSDYCGPQFGAMYFYTNSFGQDVALHDNLGNNLPMGDSMIVWGNWLTTRLGLDGFRLDNVKGIHHAYLARWGNSGAMAGKFMVGECYDGDLGVLQGWLSRMSSRPNTSVFDFNLRFNALKPMCDNSTTFDMRSLHTAGLINNGTPSTQVVTFVDNHDFDRINWQGVIDGSGHNPVVNNKKLAYAYILTHQGYPCVWWRDYFIYGLRDDINLLLGVRRWARGAQDYPTAYTGINAPSYPAGNQSKIYVMRRYGVGSPDTSGVLLMLNTATTESQVWVTAFNWQNKTLKDITGNISSTTTVQADGRVLLRAPALGYAVWVPTTFPSPYTTNVAAARIDIPSVVQTNSITPRATFVNLSTTSLSNVQTFMQISLNGTEVYAESYTITNFPAGDSMTVAFPLLALSNNASYSVVASVAPIPNTPADDDEIAGGFTTSFPPVPSVDGNLSDAQYITLAVKQNTNSGFGPDIDVQKIVYYPDVINQQLYVGVAGKLNTANNDGIGLWLNFSELSGTPAGTALGGVTGAGHYMGDTDPAHSQFKADFEVDYLFALNPGSSAANTYVDVVRRVGSIASSYLGNCGQSGTPTTGPSSSGVFSANSVQFAFLNDGLANHGFEIKIPFSELGITSAGDVQAFAMVVSATAYFSDVTVPGSVALSPLANLGFNPNFQNVPGGPYHSSLSALPVQLASFTATVISAGRVRLDWMTLSELNNFGFFVQRRRAGELSFGDVPGGFVPGHGTSLEPRYYTFTDMSAPSGSLVYRLRQVDLDGTTHFSPEISVNTLTAVNTSPLPAEYALHQNYPNPFNPSTLIRYDLPEAAEVTLKVYNILGQEVRTLVNERQQAGFHAVQFDAGPLPSGTYYYRISANGFTAVRKFLIIK